MTYEEKIEKMGYFLEDVHLDNGKFHQAVRVGNLIYTSGQLSISTKKSFIGKVGTDISLEEAQGAAKLCILNNLNAIKTLVGSLGNIVRIVKVFGMVNSNEKFNEMPLVLNSASEMLREIFGEAGFHARSAVGLSLPFNSAVEIEMIVEVKPL